MTTETESARAHKRERTCAGCGETADPIAMVRLVLGPENAIAVDAAGGAFGRGAHVHPSVDCVSKACKHGLARSFKANVRVEANVLRAEIADAYMRRADGLVLAAKRAHRLTVGTDETLEALAKSGGTMMVIVANDAASVVNRYEIAFAIKEGRARSWTSKATLGRMLGKEEVAVCAVTDVAMAEALRHAVDVASAVRLSVKTEDGASPAAEDRIEDETCLEDR